jgi:hypothetical protein
VEQRIGKLGTGGDEVLAVIEHEQQVAAPERRTDRVNGGPTGTLTDVYGAGDGRAHRGRIGDGRELDQPHTIRIAIEDVGGKLKGKTRLSAASGSGQRQEPGRFQELCCVGQLVRAPDKGRRLRRKVVGRGIETPQRGEIVG